MNKEKGVKITNTRHDMFVIITNKEEKELIKVGKSIKDTLENGLEFDFESLEKLGINYYDSEVLLNNDDNFEIIKEYQYWC